MQKRYDTVIWATDGSLGADAALNEALVLAEATGAHLVAVHCDQRLTGRASAFPKLADEEDVLARIRHQVAELKDEGVDVDLVVRRSHHEAADVVAAIAAERDAYLIVCGTRGLGAFGRIFRGSFTQRLLHIAPCPVLAVPEPTAVADKREREKAEVRA